MLNFMRGKISRLLGMCVAAVLVVSILPSYSQTADDAVIQGIDNSVASRDQNVVSYSVTEHYSVFRNQDKTHPVAEMTVKTAYQRDKGKSFTVLNESGSELIRKQVLARVFEGERTATQPANRATALITSANYTMQVKGRQVLDGRSCINLSIAPRRSSPYLFQGELWVDALDYSIVHLSGLASKSPSMLAGQTQVARHYANFDGFPMATHATAISNSWLLGQTTIEIEYTGYQIEVQDPH
jgi:hypothetical protein